MGNPSLRLSIEKIWFLLKLFSGHFYGQSFIKTVRGPLYIVSSQGNNQISNDFSLTVKAATLIFISGCGSAISSAKEGKSGFIYNLVILSRANVRALHENPNRIHNELTFINP